MVGFILNIKKEFGEKIKRMRKSRKLTQEKLAEMIDISPRTLSCIEIGANFVKAETLEKIIKALNTTTEELFANEHLQDCNTLYKNIINLLKSARSDRKKLEHIYKIVKYFVNE